MAASFTGAFVLELCIKFLFQGFGGCKEGVVVYRGVLYQDLTLYASAILRLVTASPSSRTV
jgi:hypothetical protein